jgi:pimeloyl-ACP methyl ester carboxylesterase
LKSAFATSPDGNRIHFQRAGDAQLALVFVHGLACGSDFWAAQVEHFQDRYTCVAMDLAGHGPSGSERRDWTIEAFAGDVAAVVRTVGLPAVLVGHSLGGPVCVEAALQLPELACGVIGVESFHWFGMGLTPESIEAAAAPYEADYAVAVAATVRSWFPPGSDPAQVERLLAAFVGLRPEMAVNAFQHCLAWHIDRGPQALGLLSVPLCTINSAYLHEQIAVEPSRLLMEVELIQDVGHWPMIEQPAVLNRILTRRLARQGKAACVS